MNKGFMVRVLTNGDEISTRCKLSDFKWVTLVGDGVPQMDTPCAKAPAVLLNRRTLPSCLGGRVHVSASPLVEPAGSFAFGGAFLWSGDSRFSALTGDGGPIPLHDYDLREESRLDAENIAAKAAAAGEAS